MIKIKNVSKNFEQVKAVDQITLTIQNGLVFGMLGTNGAGKSTLLRMMAGVLKPDAGQIYVDGEPVWDNPKAKSKFFYISDDQFFYPNATPSDLISFYKNYYPAFDEIRFREFLASFGLDYHRKISTFSKGMKKQISILLGICSNASYLFCDETFDGLDPVMRQAIKSLFAKEMEEREFTPIIASHSLRELEDICDHIGLLHKGGVLLSKELEDLKCNLTKVQCVLSPEHDEYLNHNLNILKMQRRGKLLTMTVRGKEEEIETFVTKLEPVYYESLPLTLEEIFISETEVVGYDMQSLIM